MGNLFSCLDSQTQGRQLSQRILEHVRDIKNDRGVPVSDHFNLATHRGCVDLEAFVLRHCADTDSRKRTEKKLILSLGTLKPAENEGPKSALRWKMVIVGDGYCGKTGLVSRVFTGTFFDNGYLPTVFETDVINLNTGKEEVDLTIFDTAGQEDYDRLRPFSYHGVDVAIVCFSLADTETLTNVMEKWSPEVRYYCGDILLILVGNKKDLRDSPGPEFVPSSPSKSSSAHSANFHVQGPVKHSQGTLAAKRIGAIAYFETSALSGDNVEELLLATTKASVLGSKKSKEFKPFMGTLKSWKSVSGLEKSAQEV